MSMTDMQTAKIRSNNAKPRKTSAPRDLVIITIVSILVFTLSYFFDLFNFILKFLDKHPRMIIYVDEVITLLLTLSISFAVFSWRRLLELKKETAERIRIEEELIRIANTEAETERIISHQLHTEIALRRQTEGNSSADSLKKKKRLYGRD